MADTASCSVRALEQLAAIAADLKVASADLDSHIELRATELAAPRIQAAEAAAQHRVHEAEVELRQAGELIAELRIQLDLQSRLHAELLAEKRAREARTATRN